MKELKLNVNGTELTTFMSEENGEQLIALKPLCEALGVNFKIQKKKLQNNPQFSWGYLSTPSGGQNREMLCIPPNSSIN